MRCSSIVLVAVAVLCTRPADAFSAPGTSVSLSNGGLTVVLSTATESFGSLLSMTTAASQSLLRGPTQALWSAQFANTAGSPVTVDPTTTTAKSHSVTTKNATAASLSWDSLPIGSLDATVNATLDLQVTSAGLCELRLSLAAPQGKDTVALWQQSIGVSQVSLSNASSLLENSGFGLAHRCGGAPFSCQGWSNSYPQATFQFMGAFEEGIASPRPAFYIAAHDPKGASKSFIANVDTDSGTVAFSVQSIVPNAGVCEEGHIHGDPHLVVPRAEAAAYPVVIGAVPQGMEGGWWDLAQVYRHWALDEAVWTSKGPLSARADVPPWLLNVTTWINSHWQGNDIFNTSGGDPALVRNRVSAIHKRFGPTVGSQDTPLAFHWYEWDTLGYKKGSNYTECETEVTCGFDTHYPDLYPTPNYHIWTYNPRFYSLQVRHPLSRILPGAARLPVGA